MYNDKELIVTGVTMAFSTFEKTKSLVLREMLIKALEVTKIKMTRDVVSDEEKDKIDALVKSIEKYEEKINTLNKLLDLKEECIELFKEE